MGLDVSHDCWHGAYSAFLRWRHKLAEVAGYEIATIRYDDGWPSEMETIMLDWGHLGTEEHLMGKWDKTPDDPLLVLLVHSDCDGYIYPEQMEPLARRLEELLPLLPKDDDRGHIGNWKNKTQQFIDGLQYAVMKDEVVEFY